MWRALNVDPNTQMKDNRTGFFIFESRNPASIVFDCGIKSPCGNIRFIEKRPSGSVIYTYSLCQSLSTLSSYSMLYFFC